MLSCEYYYNSFQMMIALKKLFPFSSSLIHTPESTEDRYRQTQMALRKLFSRSSASLCILVLKKKSQASPFYILFLLPYKRKTYSLPICNFTIVHCLGSKNVCVKKRNQNHFVSVLRKRMILMID